MSILAAYANTGTILNNYSEAFVQGNYSEVTSALAGALTEPQRNVWDSATVSSCFAPVDDLAKHISASQGLFAGRLKNQAASTGM
jgi:ubiquinone biosynthesis protein UbiJ